jgi:hypothetical protein
LTILALGIWLTSVAQTPPDEETSEVADAAAQANELEAVEVVEQELPCEPSTDVTQAQDDESGPLDSRPEEDGVSEEDATAAVPCPDEAPEAAAGEDPASVEGAEASDEEVGEGEATSESELAANEEADPAAGQLPESEDFDPGMDDSLEELPDEEVSAEDEFESGDEISEDYPVPLPADI